MPIHVVVEDENGKVLYELEEGFFLSARLLPSPADTTYLCLRFVDEYGDTVFNHLQIPVVIEEVKRLCENAENDRDKAVLGRIFSLAEQCRARPHRYLRFVGD